MEVGEVGDEGGVLEVFQGRQVVEVEGGGEGLYELGRLAYEVGEWMDIWGGEDEGE